MPTVAFHTLGCKVNQYDTQAMRELFLAAGYSEVARGADVVLINTCTVTSTSDQKSRQLIRRARRDNPECAVIVSGCLSQRAPEAVKLPGVRLVLGTQHRGKVVELLRQSLEEDSVLVAVEDLQRLPFEPLSVTAHEGRSRAVLKIQEGCDAACAYCIIPSVRGKSRSKPLDQIAAETSSLVNAGYREIVLTGIALTGYGRDLGCGLIDAISAVAASARRPDAACSIRLGSLEPQWLTVEHIDALAAITGLVPAFHLSLQSGSATVIARMNRSYRPEAVARSMERMRMAMPGSTFRADVIVGFPEETDEEHSESCAFVQGAGFAGLHVFPYSPRSGTPAATRPQVPDAVKARRTAEMGAIARVLEPHPALDHPEQE